MEKVIAKYDHISLESADNGIEISFTIIKENEDYSFEPRMTHRKEYVFEHANMDKAFELIKSLVTYNMKKKKGETVSSVVLPS